MYSIFIISPKKIYDSVYFIIHNSYQRNIFFPLMLSILKSEWPTETVRLLKIESHLSAEFDIVELPFP